MKPRLAARTWSLIVGLWSLGACAANPTTASGPRPNPAPGELDTVSQGSWVRLAVGPRRLEGHLQRVDSDSVAVRGEGVSTVVARGDLDTAWVRGREFHTATTGALLGGGLLAGAIVVGGSQSSGSEGSGGAWLLAFRVMAIALAIGIGNDILAPTPWRLVFVR